jgi:hypothetical protein
MKTYFRLGAAALVLMAGASAAQAQTTVITREAVELTPAQRTTIYRTIVREPRTIVRPPVTVVERGPAIPERVEVYEMPETVVAAVPQVRRYRYMVVNNEVLLVDPQTSEVVEIIRP